MTTNSYRLHSNAVITYQVASNIQRAKSCMIRHKARSANQHQMSIKRPGKILERLRKTVMKSKGYVVGFLKEIHSSNG